MTPLVQTMISACQWAPSHFLIISDNVFSPLLYYSYFGSVIPTLLIALFIFFKGPKKLASRLLLLMVLSFTMWVFANLVTWATEVPAYVMFFWALLVLIEPLVYFLAFYFFYVLVFEKDFSTVQKILFSTPLLVTFLLTPTRLGLLGYNLSNCDRVAVEGIGAIYGYIIELLYVFLILRFAIYFIKKTEDVTEKRKAMLVTAGVVTFLLSLSLGNMIESFSQNWYIGQYGLFGAPIFVGFLAYTMVKYKTFNIKLVEVQALVVAALIAVFSLLFIEGQTEITRIIITLTSVLILIIGILLVRGALKEVAQREEIAKMAEDLKTAYITEKQLSKKIADLSGQAMREIENELKK